MVKRITLVGFLALVLNSIYASSSRQSSSDPLMLANYSSVALIDYLKTDSSLNEYDKTIAIWDWIYTNINYDIKAYEKGKIIPGDPNYSIAQRKTLCEGYAELFNYFARFAGLQSVKVEGYVKDNNFYYEKTFLRSNHAWNSVRIDGKWYLLDATWGGSTVVQKEGKIINIISKVIPLAKVKNQNIVIKEQKNEWFLVPPDSFIFTHLPADPVWQLLDCPVPFSAFISTPDTIQMYMDASYSSGCEKVVYSDSINQLIHLPETEQDMLSGQRAQVYNPQNLRIIATAYSKYNVYQWNYWLNLANKPRQEKLNSIIQISSGFDQAKTYYTQEKTQIRNEHNLLVKKNRYYNKLRTKSCDTYVNKNKKIIEKNNANIQKSNAIKKDYSGYINQLKKQNNNLLYDDKIYSVNRARVEPGPDDMAQVIAYFNTIAKNNQTIDSIKNSLTTDYDQKFTQQIDHYRSTKSALISLTDSNIVYTSNYIALINFNNPIFMEEMDRFHKLVANNRDTLAAMRTDIVESEKKIVKEGSKELKRKHAEIYGFIKNNKNLLKEIKKLSIMDRSEEALYDIETERLINENNELINRYTATSEQLTEGKSYIKEENEILKNESRAYKNLIKYENLRFKAETKREQIQYKFYTGINSQDLKNVNLYLTTVNKTIKTLETK